MDFKTQAGMGMTLLKQYGIRDFYYRFREWCDFQIRNRRYQKNRDSYFPGEQELEMQRKKQWAFAPLISIVVPTYETDERFLRQLLDSVLGQTYGNLELCLADGSSSDKVLNVVNTYKDDRISYQRLEKNAGISENTNQGFAMAKGEYLALLDHDDLLTPNALYEMVKVLNETDPRPDMIYSDEDKMVGDSADYCDPNFKPDYNEELLRRNNYICHFLLFSREILEKAGGLDSDYDGAQDHEFVLRCRRNGADFYHIPKVLYHWRVHPSSTAYDPGSKLYAYENGKKAIRDYLKSRGVEARVELTKDLGIYQVSYERNKKMSVAVLTRDEQSLERLKSKTKLSEYTEISWHLADGADSRSGAEKADSRDQAGHSASYRQWQNEEIAGVSADYVVLAEDGMLPESENWLESLLSFCQEERIGAVSGTFLSTGHKILQSGMIVSEDGTVYPLFEGLPEIYRGYCHRADVPENVSTLSLDFVLLSKRAWQEAGRFSGELSFPAGEVDFFGRLRECGYEAVVDTQVKILCPRGWSRDYSMKPEEQKKLKQRWGSQWKQGDLAYNVNLWKGDGRFTFKIR